MDVPLVLSYGEHLIKRIYDQSPFMVVQITYMYHYTSLHLLIKFDKDFREFETLV